MKRLSVLVEDVRVGDRLAPDGDQIEEVLAISVGPEWIVAAWIRGADYDGSGLPSITWPDGAEVEVWR